MNNKWIIELKNVTVEKGKNIILDNINLCIEKNEFVGIIGPNGAGKSTLLNVIAGLERFKGVLKISGETETWNRERRKRLKIGYLPQQFEMEKNFPISVIEAVLTGALGRVGLLHGLKKTHINQAYEIMEILRISHLAKKPVGKLSGGERQKVLLARTLMQNPEILLLDEPTTNLDIAVQKEFLDLITDIYRREKITILFVTHDFNLIPLAMKRAVLLNNGKLIFDGSITEALTEERLKDVFQITLEAFTIDGKRFISYDV